MIVYDTIQTKYSYKTEDLDRIIELFHKRNLYDEYCCTQENISDFIMSIEKFMSNIQSNEEMVTLERHETEEEAREYFGTEFVSQFDQLLTMLDRQETVVAIHGTHPEVCSSICDNGLRNTGPSLPSTAVSQNMAYGQNDMHYDDYEGLLNWGHKNYKGLVIVAVPYECYYKEGLWNHFRDSEYVGYGAQNYKIDPDFIVGYIDVNNKKIVLNPKYNRQHNYEGYKVDTELFREKKGYDNEKLRQSAISFSNMIRDREICSHYVIEEENEDTIDVSKIPIVIEDLICVFNAIKRGSPNCMTEDAYKSLLASLDGGFKDFKKLLPLLKTAEQIKKEKEESFSMFSDNPELVQSTEQFSDFGDFDWGDFSNWDEQFEQSKMNL